MHNGLATTSRPRYADPQTRTKDAASTMGADAPNTMAMPSVAAMALRRRSSAILAPEGTGSTMKSINRPEDHAEKPPPVTELKISRFHLQHKNGVTNSPVTCSSCSTIVQRPFYFSRPEIRRAKPSSMQTVQLIVENRLMALRIDLLGNRCGTVWANALYCPSQLI